MIPDTTLETILNLWKEGKVNLSEVRSLLNLERPIKWKQTEPMQSIPSTQQVGIKNPPTTVTTWTLADWRRSTINEVQEKLKEYHPPRGPRFVKF